MAALEWIRVRIHAHLLVLLGFVLRLQFRLVCQSIDFRPLPLPLLVCRYLLRSCLVPGRLVCSELWLVVYGSFTLPAVSPECPDGYRGEEDEETNSNPDVHADEPLLLSDNVVCGQSINWTMDELEKKELTEVIVHRRRRRFYSPVRI